MNDLEATLASIRSVESEDNYDAQQDVRVGSDRDMKVGAYGYLRSRWEGLTKAYGYEGADWRNRDMQDRIAQRKIEEDFQELGSYELAAVAWRFGMRSARYIRDTQSVPWPEVEQYLTALKRAESKVAPGIIGRSPRQREERASPTRVKAEGALRRQLVMMRNAQRRGQEPQ